MIIHQNTVYLLATQVAAHLDDIKVQADSCSATITLLPTTPRALQVAALTRLIRQNYSKYLSLPGKCVKICWPSALAHHFKT